MTTPRTIIVATGPAPVIAYVVEGTQKVAIVAASIVSENSGAAPAPASYPIETTLYF